MRRGVDPEYPKVCRGPGRFDVGFAVAVAIDASTAKAAGYRYGQYLVIRKVSQRMVVADRLGPRPSRYVKIEPFGQGRPGRVGYIKQRRLQLTRTPGSFVCVTAQSDQIVVLHGME